MYLYVQSAFILFNVLTKQIKTSEEIPPQRREVIVSGDGHCLCWAVALWKDETSDEKYEEIPRSSDSLFEKNPKVFKPSNFSLNSLEDLVRKSKITGTPVETVDINSVVYRSFSDLFVPIHLRRRKGLILSRFSTYVRSHWSKERSNLGV